MRPGPGCLLATTLVATAGCGVFLGGWTTHASYALGFEGEVSQFFVDCVLPEPSAVFTRVPGTTAAQRAVTTGVARFECGKDGDIHMATVEVPARLEVKLRQSRIPVGDRGGYSVVARAASGRELRISKPAITFEGAIGGTTAQSRMDFGAALDLFEGRQPGLGHVRATFGGLTASGTVEVVPRAAAATSTGADATR